MRPSDGPSDPTDPSGCHRVRCDCDTPGVPPAPASAAPSAPDLDDHATASPVPPLRLPVARMAAARVARSTPVCLPTDLVISLSRLTC